MQRGLGNGSCGPGTESQYKCPESGSYTHLLRFSTVNGKDTGIDAPGVAACEVVYDSTVSAVVCSNVEDGTEVAVMNLGGMQVGSARVNNGVAVVSLAEQPKGAYILVIRNDADVRSHRFIKW